jgi:hypothetical protein
MGTRTLCLLLLAAAGVGADEKYDGPLPPKPDIPYLLEATKLIGAEVTEAREEKGTKETTYVIAGTSSSARTPQAEPVFIIDAREIAPDHVELYQLEVKDGNREASFANKAHKGSAQPLHLLVTRLKGHLYKIEASEMLATGEYALSPSGDNRVFCFEVY